MLIPSLEKYCAMMLPNPPITEFSSKYPEAGAWVGGGRQIDANNHKMIWERMPPPLSFKEILNWRDYYLPQPSCFMNRDVIGNELHLNESYHIEMDFDLWLRISKKYSMIPISQILSINYRHENAKTARVDLLYRSMAEKWTILLEQAGIDYTAERIKDEIHREIELVYKLRHYSKMKPIAFFKPLIKKLSTYLNNMIF